MAGREIASIFRASSPANDGGRDPDHEVDDRPHESGRAHPPGGRREARALHRPVEAGPDQQIADHLAKDPRHHPAQSDADGRRRHIGEVGEQNAQHFLGERGHTQGALSQGGEEGGHRQEEHEVEGQ